jgi:hypothetical protein
METATTEIRPRRVRTVVYLEPAERRRLKVEGAESDRPMGDIVEEALRQRRERRDQGN